MQLKSISLDKSMNCPSHLPKFRKSDSTEVCTPISVSWLLLEKGAMYIQAFDIKIGIYDCFECHWHVEVPFIKQTLMAGLAIQAEPEDIKLHN